MATAAPKLAPFDYTLESDKDAAAPTVFRLRPLQSFEYHAASDIWSNKNRGEAYAYILRTALLGWTKFVDAGGGEVPFAARQTENLARLTVAQMGELASKVLEASMLDEAARKN